MAYEVQAYRKILSDLESYLDHEINEWICLGKKEDDFIAAVCTYRHEARNSAAETIAFAFTAIILNNIFIFCGISDDRSICLSNKKM